MRTGPRANFTDDQHTWQIDDNDQLFTAEEYRPLIVAYRNGAAVRLSRSRDGERFGRGHAQFGLANGKPAVLVIVYRQPGANIIETVDRVQRLLPQLKASIPPAIDLNVVTGSHHDHSGLGRATSSTRC